LTIPGGILGNFYERIELQKIQGYRSIKLIELDPVSGWNTWNMFLNEYGKILVGRFDHSRQYSGKFLGTLRAMENLRLPFDRAHRVGLKTGLEHLEHVPKRI
jgi:hypothetical protein